MQYIKLDTDKYVAINDELNESSIISKSAVETEIQLATEQLALIPASLTDEQLLAWAKENYTNPDQRNRDVLEETIAKNSALLAELV